MADPKATSGETPEFFVECDERSGSVYNSLFREASFTASARQGRMIINVKVLPKPGTTSSKKKTTGS